MAGTREKEVAEKEAEEEKRENGGKEKEEEEEEEENEEEEEKRRSHEQQPKLERVTELSQTAGALTPCCGPDFNGAGEAGTRDAGPHQVLVVGQAQSPPCKWELCWKQVRASVWVGAWGCLSPAPTLTHPAPVRKH